METSVGTGKERQFHEEQRLLGAMYSRLDAELAGSLSARKRAMAADVHELESLSARDLEVSRLTERIGQLRSSEHSLCFGRIDSGMDGSSLHIGRIGLRTEAGEPLLVDWRAEAARPFYAATMASPLGVRRRRHVRVSARTVVDVNDEILDGSEPGEEDVVGDGPLVAALSSARTGRMRQAAATLQAEQDEIVRSPHRGIMVVDGGPGTGKTIVALHRAAYVLYAFPVVAKRGVLVFGPNKRFIDYIADVLPSLGENDVRLATLPDLVGAEVTQHEPDDLARIKGRAGLAQGLARWVQARQPQHVPLELQTAHGTVTLDPELVDAARRGALQGGIGHNQARELFTERVVEELVNELEQQSASELADFEVELKEFHGVDLDRMFGGGSGRVDSEEGAEAMDGLEIDWDRIHEELLDDPGIDRSIAGVWPRLRAEDAVRGLLSDRAALADALPDLPEQQLVEIAHFARAGWSSVDLALLDEARALIDGTPEAIYGHIVVDEAQQLSEMQWRLLMRRCPQHSMTVVGDLAQAGPTTTIRSWREALDPFASDGIARHTLTVNYRTTAEILEETRPLLARIAPGQQLSRSIRHGQQPIVVTAPEDDIPSALVELIASARSEHPEELIGVIATVSRAAMLEAELDGTGAAIVAAPDARGLEFDTVIIVDPDGIQSRSEAGLQDCYVAQTRATKRLATVMVADIGNPSAR